MNTGKSLRILMAAKNISSNELAEKLGCTTQTIVNYRKNENQSFIAVEKLADFFEMSADKFIAVADKFPD